MIGITKNKTGADSLPIFVYKDRPDTNIFILSLAIPIIILYPLQYDNEYVIYLLKWMHVKLAGNLILND